MNKIIVIILIALLYIPGVVKAEIEFNPNNIISDKEALDWNSMSLTEIQSFLTSKGGYLSRYKTADTYGNIKSAAEIIYNASTNNYDCDGISLSENPSELERKLKCRNITTVNPKFLLTLLQKEMSLVEDKNPRTTQLDSAMGYGCYDGQKCNPRWKGFGKQVNSAALQFSSYLKEPNTYAFKVGNTYSFTNPYSTLVQGTTKVTPVNNATAALYNYTPHVYNGNYNFYKIWNKYFPSSYVPTLKYPDGSLLQANGEIGVWLIDDGKKRPFLSKGALTSRFDENKIIIVSSSDLDIYEKSAPIKFPNYSIVTSPDGKKYLLVDDRKREFENDAAFRSIGFNTEEVEEASWEDINSYETGSTITTASTYPTGALLQNNKTGGVYWVEEGEKSPVIDKAFLNTKFKGKKIIPIREEELATYITIDPILFNNGELLKSKSSSAVYLISDNIKKAFTSGKAFESLGYKWNNIIEVSPQLLALYPNGAKINN